MSDTKIKEQSLAINGGEAVRKEPMPPWPNYGDEEIEAATRALRSGKFSRLSGSEVVAFEEEYAEKFGVKHAIAVSSGTAAIHVALSALGVGPGDDVIHTPHCFIGTATPSAHAGAVPIFADIDPRTYNIDPASIEEKITPYTKAIVPVHLNGLPADMDPILELAEKHDLYVVEDAAQAHGATYKGRLAGTIGHVGCFSFWEDKILTTAGEGGMIITNDDEIAERARVIQHHGEEPDDGTYYVGERLYYHTVLGYNFRMSEVHGAVGRVQLRRLDDYVAARRRNARSLSKRLSQIAGITLPYEPSYAKHAFYKYIIRLDRDVLDTTAKQFVEALLAEGIPCSRRYPTPLHQQPVFTEKRGYGHTSAPFTEPWYPGNVDYTGELPNAERLPEELVRLSINPALGERELDDIATAVAKVANAYRRDV